MMLFLVRFCLVFTFAFSGVSLKMNAIYVSFNLSVFPTKADAAAKDKSKPWHYAPDIEPSEDILKIYVDHMSNCGIYKTEYKECTSFNGRMNQRFVYGQKVNCEHLKDAYDSCTHFLKTKDEKARDYLVSYEMAKRNFRMTNAQANDVWEYRTTPYAEWNSKLQKVSIEEIELANELMPGKVNLNQNNSNTEDENKVKATDKPGTNDANSDAKGGNSKTDLIKKIEDSSVSNKKGWCAVS